MFKTFVTMRTKGIKDYPGTAYYSLTLVCPDLLWTFRDTTVDQLSPYLTKLPVVHFIYHINLRCLRKGIYNS